MTIGTMPLRRDLAHALAYGGVRHLGHARHASCVTVVDDAKHVEWGDLELQVPLAVLIRGRAHRTRAESRSGPVGDSLVPGRADDRDVGAHLVELVGAS